MVGHWRLGASIGSALRRMGLSREVATSGRPTRRIPRPILGFPAGIFRLGLDVLVPRLVLLETRGHRSGLRRGVVLNIAAREGDDLIVMSVDGRRAGWVRNLMAEPRVVAHQRGRSFAARASVDESIDPGDLAVALYRERPRFVHFAYRFTGERIESESDVRRLASERVPVRITPLAEGPAERDSRA